MRLLHRAASATLAASLAALTLGALAPSAHATTGAAIRITEFAYGGKVVGSTTGGDGEYVELTNTGDAPQDMSGWTYDNSIANAATGLSLNGLGTIAPGESAIVTDVTAAEFRTDWGLSSTVKVLSNLKTHTLNGGPNAVHVYDGTATEVDSVSYASGFESAKGKSAWVDAAHVGLKADTTGWTISTAADSEASWTSATGSIGSPGASTLGASTPGDVRAAADVQITEFAYGGLIATGGDGEYVELTNLGEAAQDMTGWTWDNGDATVSPTSIAVLGTVAPGESVLLTDADPAAFRTEWHLKASVKVIGDGISLNKGPNGIHVYDAGSTEVDSVTYASGFLPAKGRSAWVDAAHVGAMADTTGWTLSTAADGEGSWTSIAGSIGSPGASTLGTVTPADVNDGSGDPVTPPTDPNFADISINEITSDNSGNGFAPLDADDLVELRNNGTHAVSLDGWKQTDSNAGGFASAAVFSTGLYVDGALATTIPAGGYGVFSSVPGLSSAGDSVKVYTPDGTLVDQLDYTAGQAGVDETINTDHTYHALAACPDGSNTFLEVPTATFGGTNGACTGGVTPLSPPAPEAPCQTEDSGTAPGTVPAGVTTWPGSATPTTIDDQCSWVTSLSGQDLSGLAFDGTDVLYAVKNKSHVWRLLRSGASWVKDTANGWADGKDLRFPGGTGLPDSEGLTVGPDGSLYITTERDNAASGVPLDSVLRFDPTTADTTLTPTDQWVLTSDLGFTAADANLGFEGITYVPDAFLVANGFTTDAGTAYDPTTYAGKATAGLFFAAVEKTGHLRAYALNTDHTFTRVADVDTGMVGVMDVQYDADLGRIWAHCDNTCGNATTLLKVGTDGHVAIDQEYATPANLPNYNLEGFAVAPLSTATDGTREVLWTDDGDRFGHSVWSGTVDVDLGLAMTAPTPTISGTPTMGETLTAAPGSWSPTNATLTYAWLADGQPIAGATGTTFELTPDQVGKAITVEVTGTRTGFASTTASSAATPAVAAAALTTATPTISGTPRVGRTLTATAGAWGPSGVSLSYAWYAGGQPVAGATASTLKIGPALRGKAITVAVTGMLSGYSPATTTSAPTAAVTPGVPSSKVPTVTGTARVGKVLTAHPGTWTAGGGKVTLRYQWLVNGKAIKGATHASLKLTKAQKGKRVSVRVTGSSPGYTTVSRTSKATGAVK